MEEGCSAEGGAACSPGHSQAGLGGDGRKPGLGGRGRAERGSGGKEVRRFPLSFFAVLPQALPAGTRRANPGTPSVRAEGVEARAFPHRCRSGLSEAAPGRPPAPPAAAGQAAAPGFALPKGSSSGRKEMQISPRLGGASSGSSKPSASCMAARGAGALWETTHSPGSSAEQMAEQTAPGFLFHIIFCPTRSHF